MAVHRTYKGIVIGCSAGGLEVLSEILPELDKNINAFIVVVQHISPYSENYLAHFLNQNAKIKVVEAEEKMMLKAGTAYIAPPNYHLLIEKNLTTSLSTEAKVNYSRPSIDVSFETAAWALGNKVIGVVLTGANYDGSKGLLEIANHGGTTIVQDPKDAKVNQMPQSALKLVKPDFILKSKSIAEKLNQLAGTIPTQ